MRMFKKDEGFTLVELMVVVLIIGILVAIAIPVFNAASASARQRTCHSNMRTIEGAVEQWLAAAPNNTRTTCDGLGWKTANAAILFNGLVGPTNYIKVEPFCPSSMVAGGDAVYTYDGTDDGATTDLEAICGSDNVTGTNATATGSHIHYSDL